MPGSSHNKYRVAYNDASSLIFLDFFDIFFIFFMVEVELGTLDEQLLEQN